MFLRKDNLMNRNLIARHASLRGFTLIELMLVVGLISIIGLGIAEFTRFQLRSSQSVQNSSSAAILESQLNLIFSRNDSCDSTLMDLRTGDTVRFIRNGDGTILYDTINDAAAGRPFPLTEWILSNVRILSATEVQNLPQPIPPTISTEGVATLVISATFNHRSTFGGGASTQLGASSKNILFRVNASLSTPLHVKVNPMITKDRAREICNTVFPGLGTPTTRTLIPEATGADQTIQAQAETQGVVPVSSTIPSISSFSSFEEVPGNYDPGFGPKKALHCNFSSYEVRISKCVGADTSAL